MLSPTAQRCVGLVVFVLLCTSPFASAAINPDPNLRVRQICFFDGFSAPVLHTPPRVSTAEASDPQWRCIEEPASALLSVVAAAVHFHLLLKFRRCASPDYPFHRATCAHSFGWIFTSAAAVLLHVHEDRPHFIHEKMDYYGVFVTLCVAAYLAFVHLMRLAPSSATRSRAKFAACLVSVCFILYMQFVHFNYGLHVALCAALMSIISVFYIVKYMQGKCDHVRPFLCGSLVLLLASPCEFFDFLPIFGHLDGHALWHLAAIPVAFLWNAFFRADAEIHRGLRSKQAL
jgi:hypothetical protein